MSNIDFAIYTVHSVFWGAFVLTRILLRRRDRKDSGAMDSAPVSQQATSAPFSRTLVAFHALAFTAMYVGIGMAVIPQWLDWFQVSALPGRYHRRRRRTGGLGTRQLSLMAFPRDNRRGSSTRHRWAIQTLAASDLYGIKPTGTRLRDLGTHRSCVGRISANGDRERSEGTRGGVPSQTGLWCLVSRYAPARGDSSPCLLKVNAMKWNSRDFSEARKIRRG
jgi:hypothetical protein